MRKHFFALKKSINEKTKSFTAMMKNEKGQGTAEYVLLLAIVVGLLVAFGPKIKSAISSKMDSVSNDIQNFQ